MASNTDSWRVWRVIAAVGFWAVLVALAIYAMADGAPANAGMRAGLQDSSALADPSRSDDDRYRDGGFKPLEVYDFFGVESGMTVGDLWTSRMYNAHILAHLVGDEGTVLAIVTPGDEASERAMQRAASTYEERNATGALSNVKVVGSLSEVPDNSLDVLITVRNYHDLGEKEARLAFLPKALRVLKPGGIFGVVDANTDKPDERDESVHRINADLVIDEITSGGFEYVGSSDVLHNPDDTFDFDGREDDAPIHRYYIDRFVQKYRKPAR
jgi:predicted methyltransferase